MQSAVNERQTSHITQMPFRQTAKLRVCMVGYTIYEFDHRVTRYAEALVERGDSVDVIALRLEEQQPREVLNGVDVCRIQKRTFREKGQWSYLIRVLFFFARAMILLTAKQIKNPYDLVHVHSVPDFLVFVAWLPKLMGSKIILDIHDVLPEFYASKFNVNSHSLAFKSLVMIERASASFSDHVIIANDIWKDRLLSRSVKGKKCTALLNFPDRNIFRPRGRKVASDGDKFIILYPGTLNWHQGLDVAIRAFAIVKDRLPNTEFHIYGRGGTKDSLVELSRGLGLAGRIVFRDPLPLRQIATVMENSDLAIVPKRKDSFGNEAFSTKILEFMALGVPVIVSDTKIDQYYFNTSIVRFFHSDDERDLAQCILTLVSNQRLRHDLVRNATEYIKENDWAKNKLKYLELADSLVARQSVA